MEHLFPKNDWTAFLIKNGIPDELNKNKKNLLLELLDQCHELLNTSKVGKAIDRISLGLLLDKSSFLSNLKRSGLLRNSRYIASRNPIVGIAKHILYHRQFFQIDENDKQYFESLINLEKLYIEIKHLRQELYSYIKNYKASEVKINGHIVGKKSIIKTLLSINEFAFLSREYTKFGSLHIVGESSVNLEQQSEAISYLVSFISEVTPKNEFGIFMDDDLLKKDRYMKMLNIVKRLKEFRELEMQIENLGYICVRNDDMYKLTHPNVEFLKSTALSNIMSEGQKDADAWRVLKQFKEYPSILELASAIHNTFPKAIHFSTIPFPRFRMEIPPQLIQKVASEPIGTFYEEYEGLQYIQKELGISKEMVESFELTKGLTLLDFLIIHRVFIVLQYIYSEHLSNKLTNDNHFYILSSLLVIFDKKAIDNILRPIVAEEKISQYLALMSWEYGSKSYLDLQYTPVIKANNYHIFCLSVMRHSRSIRNVIASLAKRGNNVKSNQMQLIKQISDQLIESFENKGFTCFSEVKVKYNGVNQQKSDIDFLAYKDGVVFVGECKDVLDSIDSFEYRRINDNLIKAVSQLDFINSALSDSDFNRQLGKRLNIDLSKATSIHYVIIPSSRKAWGYNISGYPVRNVHELINFLEQGTWQFQLPDQKLNVFHLWDGDSFHVNDLIKFCSDQGPHSKLYSSVFEFDTNIGQKYNLASFAMDLQSAINSLSDNYKTTIIEPTDYLNNTR